MRRELHEPLGGAAAAKRRISGRSIIAGVFAGAALLGALAFLTAPQRQPGASAEILQEKSAPPRTPALAAVAANFSSKDESDVENGVRVIRAGKGNTAGVFISVPPDEAALSAVPDPRLIEESRFGGLPKTGADGSRPFDVYRRPSLPSMIGPASIPRIALLITGVGLSATATHVAISELPAPVTLGFASLSANLQAQADEARQRGHEILLQAPMEPLGGSSAAHFPHELSTKAQNAQNLDNLHWQMARFSGYFGVMNYLGAKMTADKNAMEPVLRDIAGRGLAYVDDGTSPQSLAPRIGASLHMPVAAADVVLDADAGPGAIDAALMRLSALARERGSAIGTAAALPATLGKIVSFSEGLRAQGIALVPVSALVATRSVEADAGVAKK